MLRSPLWLLATLLGACASSPHSSFRLLPDPPGEEARGQFGRIGVVLEDTLTPPRLQEPPSEDAAGGIGAGQGALAVIGTGAQAGSVGLIAGVFLSPLGMLVGGIGGLMSAEEEAAVKAARTRIEAAFRELPPERALVDELVQRSALRDLGLRWEHDPDPARLAADCDCVLVLRIDAIGLEGPTMDVNPPLAFSLYTTARLIRLSDGRLIEELPLHWMGCGPKFVSWSADEARAVRGALAESVRATAERIVDELLLLHVGGEGAPSLWFAGLLPLEPRLDTLLGITRVDTPRRLDSLRPRFRWSEFDLVAACARDPWYTQVSGVSYDLRVWESAAPCALVYERVALATCEQRLERDLAPGTVYRWSVRPRFVRAGETRLGEWSSIRGWWRRNPFNAYRGFLVETPEH